MITIVPYLYDAQNRGNKKGILFLNKPSDHISFNYSPWQNNRMQFCLATGIEVKSNAKERGFVVIYNNKFIHNSNQSKPMNI